MVWLDGLGTPNNTVEKIYAAGAKGRFLPEFRPGKYLDLFGKSKHGSGGMRHAPVVFDQAGWHGTSSAFRAGVEAVQLAHGPVIIP